MALQVWNGFAQDDAGNVLASASVEVRDKTDNSLASLFEDRGGVTSLGNPFTSDATGQIEFYVIPGRYKITATKGASQVVFDNVVINYEASELVPTVATLAALQAVSTTGLVDGESKRDMDGRTSAGDGGEGRFVWRSGNQSANVAADEVGSRLGNGGIWIAPSSDLTGASGAWQRMDTDKGRHVAWYGATPSATNAAIGIYRAITSAILDGGDTVTFDNAVDYTVNVVARPLNFSGGTAKIIIEGNNSRLVQSNSGSSQYDMMAPGSNWTVNDLHLYGYVDSGTFWGDVVPSFSFGYRVSSSQVNVTFNRCHVDNIPYDGWYVSGNAKSVRLYDCEGGINDECYRNSVAIAPSGAGSETDDIIIWGGRYNVAKGRPAIDLEPDGGGVNNLVMLGGGVHLTGPLDIIEATNQMVVLDGVTLDGAGSDLLAYLYVYLEIRNLQFVNGAGIKQVGAFRQTGAGSPTTAVSQSTTILGNIRGLNALRNTQNLISHSYNTFDGWSFFASGSGPLVITPNSVIGPYRGIEIDATNRAALYFKTITGLSGSTVYSIGGVADIPSSSGQSVVVQEKDSGGVTTAYYTLRGGEDGIFNFLIETQPTTDRIEISYGEHNVATGTGTYGYFYIAEGLRDFWEPQGRERSAPLWSAAPTTGTWEVGDKVINETPSVDGNSMVLTEWVCTAAGTPGTWSPQYVSTVSPAI